MTATLLGATLTSAGFDVAHAGDVVTAVDLLHAFDPDAALLDIDLGHGPNGIDLAHVIAANRPDVAVLFLTQHPDVRTAGSAAGSVPADFGYLRKDMVTNPDVLLHALESVLSDLGATVRHDVLTDNPLSKFTSTQIEVLRLAARGLSNSAIARQRGTTERSVERILAAVFSTMGIRDSADVNPRVEAVRRFVAAAGLPASER